jgi:hypothetical protein
MIIAPRHHKHIVDPGKLVRLASLHEIVRGLRPGIAGGTLEVPSVSEAVMLKNILNIVAPQTMVLRLFVNNHTPAEGDALNASDYTEMSTLGYASVSLTPGSWVISGTVPTVAAYPQVTFTFTAGSLVNVYGYYVTQTTSGDLMWAERFSGAPFPIQNTGDAIQITPQITLD